MSTFDDVQRSLKALVDTATTFQDGVSQRLDDFEKRLNRRDFPASIIGGSHSADRRAWDNFIRHGREGLQPDEARALRLSDDSQGGYLAPVEYAAGILKDIVQFSPVRQASRVGQTTSAEVKIARRTGTMTATWVGEVETRSATQPSYGQISIPINEAACYVDISNQLIEDAGVDIAAELAGDLAEEFGRLEGQAFLNGDSVKKPAGIMQDANVLTVASGSASSVVPDSLITALYALAPFYRNRATWMMNGTTLALLRKAKDGSGQYLWSPGLAPGQAETILGRPVIEAVDMSDVASNAFPILVGDFASAYRIYDRVSLAVLRDPYSLATTGQTRMHARRRVGGGVVKSEALRKIRVATS